MRVDGELFEDSKKTLTSDYLTFPSSATLYVGGVKDNLPQEVPVSTSLVGGIAGLYLNGRLVCVCVWVCVCVSVCMGVFLVPRLHLNGRLVCGIVC